MNKDESRILLIAAVTLAAVLVAVIAVLLAGLFDDKVDNKMIFAVLGPAFQTIVGCFVGVMGSLALVSRKNKGDGE